MIRNKMPYIMNKKSAALLITIMSCATPGVFSPCGVSAAEAGGALSAETTEKLNIARENLLNGDAYEAVAVYGALVKGMEKPDSAVISEYAYALSLAGFRDLALINIDRARIIQPDSKTTGFYASQVLGIMGYGDLSTEIAPRGFRIPGWLARDNKKITEQYASMNRYKPAEDLATELAKANTQLANRCFFQSFRSFDGIVAMYPDEYVPRVGFSICMEKMGARAGSVKMLESAVSMMPGKEDENRKALKARIEELKGKTTPQKTESGFKFPGAGPGSQGVVFAGASTSSSGTGLSFRLGSVSEKGAEKGVDLGLSGGDFSVGYTVRTLKFYNGPDKPGLTTGLGAAYSKDGPSLHLMLGTISRYPAGDGSFDLIMDLGFSESVIGLSIRLGSTKYMGS